MIRRLNLFEWNWKTKFNIILIMNQEQYLISVLKSLEKYKDELIELEKINKLN